MFTRIRIELDAETLRRLAEVAATERRATADQAAVFVERAVRRRRVQRAERVERPPR